MKTHGIVRAIDKLGRLVIPKELRVALDMADDPLVEISQEGSRIIITKHYAGCHFCGSTENVKEFSGKKVCGKCIEQISAIAD